jgi:murein DD-endopeptidase MepM/ murein hydrolase activator NlpD
MLRKRYYILFVAREEDGRIRKIPLPLHYAYGFVAAALVGAFTIVGLAGSYTRMLLKTESFNQVRQERETLRKDYKQMAQIAHDRDVQVASLGALASEVTALYGLRQNRLAHQAAHPSAASVAAAPTPPSLAAADNVNQQQVNQSIDQFYALRTDALSGRVSRALEGGLTPSFTGDWATLADAPSMWPIEGVVTSSFGEREDPINGEGAFHSGIDISAPYGTPVRATADGNVLDESMGSGYGRQVVIDHGHDVLSVYGHLSASAVVPGQHVIRGQIIAYVGQSGRATGPHLHYEVRVHNVPVNPHKYLRMTYQQVALAEGGSSQPAGGR